MSNTTMPDSHIFSREPQVVILDLCDLQVGELVNEVFCIML